MNIVSVNIIKSILSCDSVSFHKWTVYNNIKYFVGDMICYETNNDLPKFGKIEHLIESKAKLILFLNKFSTLEYVEHLRAFQLSEELNAPYIIKQVDDLKNAFPIDLYKINKCFFVSLKYPFI